MFAEQFPPSGLQFVYSNPIPRRHRIAGVKGFGIVCMNVSTVLDSFGDNKPKVISYTRFSSRKQAKGLRATLNKALDSSIQ